MGRTPRTPLDSVRRVGSGICWVLFGLLAITTLSMFVAVVYYRITGRLLGSYTAQQMEWADVGTFLVGAVILGVPLFLGGLFLEPLPHVSGTGEKGGLAESVTLKQLPHRAPADAPSTPSFDLGRMLARSQERAAETRQERDAELLRVARSNPQFAPLVVAFEHLLQEYETREQVWSAQAERRGRRRDLILLGVGTLLGIIAPLVAAPLLRQLPFG